ncbi:MAG: hypothetical protein V3W18_01130 [candidate division Zixibacteria bacterium]
MMVKISISIIILFMILSCGDTGVSPREEPTNEDAIYNIIRFDRLAEFDIDLYDLTVPDTVFTGVGPVIPSQYWYDMERDSLFIAIDIRYVQPGDPAGTNSTAIVRVLKYFWGSLEIIGVDTTGGNNVPVRYSKDFEIVGQIRADFEKYGFDYNHRRGWILTELSDAVFSGGYTEPIGAINIHTESGFEYTVNTNKKLLSDIISFVPGDSITVYIEAANPYDYVNVSYQSVGGYATIKLPPDSSGNYLTGFRITQSLGYNHFLVDLIANDVLTDNIDFRSAAIGVVYRVR